MGISFIEMEQVDKLPVKSTFNEKVNVGIDVEIKDFVVLW